MDQNGPRVRVRKIVRCPATDSFKSVSYTHLDVYKRQRSQDGQRRIALAMRAVTESLEVSLTVQAAIKKAESSASKSWLIVDKLRFEGVVSLEMLKKAAEAGDGGESLAKLVDKHFPHLHVDQPLSLALELSLIHIFPVSALIEH